MILLILIGLLIYFICASQWIACAVTLYALFVTRMFFLQSKKYMALLRLAKKVNNRIKPNREKNMVKDKAAYEDLKTTIKKDI